MLGLILGRRAGETRADPGPLILPLFLAFRIPLASGLRSFNKEPGVVAVIGEPTTEGLGMVPLRDEGVLDGPSLGVFLEVARGVSSPMALDETCVSS